MTRRAFAIVALVWLATTLLWLQPGVLIPDGAGYYAWLPSTHLDRDLLFFDEWQRFGLIRGSEIRFKDVTATDHLSNHWTAGSAMVWYPAFLLGSAARSLVPPLRQFAANGISLPYNVPVVATSALAGLAALLIGAAIARRFVDERAAVLAAIAIWFGSPLLWYSLLSATMAHAIGAAVCALVVLLALRLREGVTAERMFSLGLAIGLAAAVRPQNAPFALVPLFLVPRDAWRAMLRKLPMLFAGGLLAALPQLIASQALYGAPLAFVNVGGAQHGNDWHPFERVWLVETLFSSYHGMFVWTPLLAVAIAGFFFLHRADRGLGHAAMTMFAAQWLINSLLDRTFWSGLAFGQRRFDNCTIFFLLGLAALFARLPRWIAIAIAALGSTWTLSLVFAARLVDLNAYQTLGELWDAQLAAIASPHFGLFVFVPPAARATILALVVLTFLAAAALALLVRRIRDPRVVSGLAAAYGVALAILFAFCARNDAAHVEPWRPLIAANRARPAGGALEAELQAMKLEYIYLRRTGRDAEAERTRSEAAAIAAEHGTTLH
jgi:hypothetical protein